VEIIEINDGEPICCPICSQVILASDGESSPEECPHTVLMATDMGIDFCDDSIDCVALEDLAEDDSWDDILSDLDRPKAILIKTYQGAPSFFGAYFLFEE